MSSSLTSASSWVAASSWAQADSTSSGAPRRLGDQSLFGATDKRRYLVPGSSTRRSFPQRSPMSSEATKSSSKGSGQTAEQLRRTAPGYGAGAVPGLLPAFSKLLGLDGTLPGEIHRLLWGQESDVKLPGEGPIVDWALLKGTGSRKSNQSQGAEAFVIEEITPEELSAIETLSETPEVAADVLHHSLPVEEDQETHPRCSWPLSTVAMSVGVAEPFSISSNEETLAAVGPRCAWPRAVVGGSKAGAAVSEVATTTEGAVSLGAQPLLQVTEELSVGPRCSWPRMAAASTRGGTGGAVLASAAPTLSPQNEMHLAASFGSSPPLATVGAHSPLAAHCAWPRSLGLTLAVTVATDAARQSPVGGPALMESPVERVSSALPVEQAPAGARCAWPRPLKNSVAPSPSEDKPGLLSTIAPLSGAEEPVFGLRSTWPQASSSAATTTPLSISSSQQESARPALSATLAALSTAQLADAVRELPPRPRSAWPRVSALASTTSTLSVTGNKLESSTSTALAAALTVLSAASLSSSVDSDLGTPASLARASGVSATSSGFLPEGPRCAWPRTAVLATLQKPVEALPAAAAALSLDSLITTSQPEVVPSGAQCAWPRKAPLPASVHPVESALPTPASLAGSQNTPRCAWPRQALAAAVGACVAEPTATGVPEAAEEAALHARCSWPRDGPRKAQLGGGELPQTARCSWPRQRVPSLSTEGRMVLAGM